MFSRSSLSYKALLLPNRTTMSDEEIRRAALDFYEHMKTRHSIRDFAPTEISQDIIEDCIRTAGSAPSGANHQPW